MNLESGKLAASSLLGAMMIENGAADDGLAQVRSEQFYLERDRYIFEAIGRIRKRDEDVDLTSVLEEIRRSGIDGIGPLCLAEMITSVGTIVNLPTYANDVRRAWLDRQIRKQAELIALGGDDRLKNEEQLRRYCVQREMQEVAPVFDFKKDWHTALKELSENKTELAKLGFSDLDYVMGGLGPGEVLTIGARTSYGKTVLASSIALNMAKAGQTVVYFCSEMNKLQIVQRFLAAESGQTFISFRTNKVDWGKVIEVCAKMSQLNFYICDNPVPTLEDIAAISFANKATVVFVDYLQRCGLPKAENHRLRIADFMRGFKNLVRDRRLIGIVNSQLDRQLDRREDKPPVLADLRESSDIEAESDSVILLWAPISEIESPGDCVLTAVVAKNRHGPRGTCKLLFEKEYMRMKKYTEHEREEEWQNRS